MIKTFKAYIKLMRPPLAIMGFLAPWAIGNYYSLDAHTLANVTGAIGFGNMAFVIANEIADERQDRINKPWKPIPSGEVKKWEAATLSISFFIISVYYLHLLPISMIKYGLIGYVTSAVYNILKIREAIGNVCLGATYYISAYISTGLTDMIFPLSFGVLTIAHNLLVQLQDYEADRQAGVSTFPVCYGTLLTSLMAFLLAMLTIHGFLLCGMYIFALASMLVVLATVYTQLTEMLVRYGVRLVMLIGFMIMLGGE